MPDEPTSTRKRVKKIFVSKDWKEQREAFLECIRRLKGRKKLREPEWKRLYGLYAGLREVMPESNWEGHWGLVKQRKQGTLHLSPIALEVIDRFIEFNALRDARWRRNAAKTGYWIDREKLKKAKDPEGYRARSAERQRQFRARKLVEKRAGDVLELDFPVAAE